MSSARPLALIFFGESFAAIEVVWSLQRGGFEVHAVNRGRRDSALSRVKGVGLHKVVAPETNFTESVEEISETVTRLRPEVIIPLDDVSLLMSSHLNADTAKLVAPQGRALSFSLDKEVQGEIASSAGLNVPSTVSYPSRSSMSISNWPSIIKPADAALVVDNRARRPHGGYASAASDVTRIYPNLSSGRVLVQKVIDGVGEGVFGLAVDGVPAHLSAHRRIRMTNPAGSASSACESIPLDADLADRVKSMIQALQWTGVFMVELLRDQQNAAWFIEVNGRPWGSMALARRQGFEYPLWAAQAALGRDLDPIPPHRSVYGLRARHLGREVVHLGAVLRGPAGRGVASWPRRLPTIRDVLIPHRGDRLYNWDRSQPLVLVEDTFLTIKDQLVRILGERQ